MNGLFSGGAAGERREVRGSNPAVARGEERGRVGGDGDDGDGGGEVGGARRVRHARAREVSFAASLLPLKCYLVDHLR